MGNAVEIAVLQSDVACRVWVSEGVKTIYDGRNRVGVLIVDFVDPSYNSWCGSPGEFNDTLALLSLSFNWIKLALDHPVAFIGLSKGR